jgi:hypothetical protein
VSIDIDTSRPARRPGELKGLLDAVRAALPSDEAEWIEWKSQLPLDVTEGWFAIARQVLALANRDPDRAVRFMGGLGYVIVGCEPGGLQGISPVDPVVLDSGLRKYLGDAGPAWSPTFLQVEGRTVLVIVVEAPRWGDPMYTLQKTYHSDSGKGGANAGTIFVRGTGDATPARPADIRRLEQRLLKGAATPELRLLLEWVGEPIEVACVDLSPAAKDEWLAERRRVLLEPLAAKQPGFVHSNLPPTGLARNMFAPVPDRRTEDEYRREVAGYLKQAALWLGNETLACVVDTEMSVVRLAVRNPSERNLPDVHLSLYVPGPFLAYEEAEQVEMPEPVAPWPWRKPKPSAHLAAFRESVSMPHINPLASLRSAPPPSMRISNEGSVQFDFIVGDLRPRETRPLDPFTLIGRGAGIEIVQAQWSATSTGVDGVCEGTFEFRVGVTPFTPLMLVAFDQEEAEESTDDD